MSCSKQDTVLDKPLASYTASKVLYYSIKLSRQGNLADISGNYVTEATKTLVKEGDPGGLLKSPIFSVLNELKNAGSARATGNDVKEKLLQIQRYSEQSGTLSGQSKLSLKKLGTALDSLRSLSSGDPSAALKGVINNYEESVHKESSLVTKDREMLLATSIMLEEQTDSYLKLGSQNSAGGRCWLCSVFNRIVTIVVAVVIVAIAAAIIVATAGAAGLVIPLITALYIGGGAGAILGGYAVHENYCWQLIDYGQSPPQVVSWAYSQWATVDSASFYSVHCEFFLR